MVTRHLLFSFIALALTLLPTGFGCLTQPDNRLLDGDILFQDFESNQNTAIKLATHSPWSHCGVVFYEGRQPMVWEAVNPVKITPLKEWIARNDSSYYEVRRIKNRDTYLTDQVITRMKTEGRRHLGKPYDIYFEWADDNLYCSEFVWKLYKRAAGIEVGLRHPLTDYDLSHPVVKSTMAERYGDSLPLDELIVSPEDIYRAEILEPVLVNRR